MIFESVFIGVTSEFWLTFLRIFGRLVDVVCESLPEILGFSNGGHLNIVPKMISHYCELLLKLVTLVYFHGKSLGPDSRVSLSKGLYLLI